MLLEQEASVFVLANWKIASCVSPSGATLTCLCGHVFGNPNFNPGQFVQTSTVKSHTVEFDSLIVLTRNGSEYWLGKPDPAESFAVQRLLRYLQESESVQLVKEGDESTRMRYDSVAAALALGPVEKGTANLTLLRRRASDGDDTPTSGFGSTRKAEIKPDRSGDRAAGAAA
jgi:hypothetical protein